MNPPPPTGELAEAMRYARLGKRVRIPNRIGSGARYGTFVGWTWLGGDHNNWYACIRTGRVLVRLVQWPWLHPGFIAAIEEKR